MTDGPSVDLLVARWKQLRDHGRELSIADLCRDCPELIDEVKAALNGLIRSDHGPAPETRVGGPSSGSFDSLFDRGAEETEPLYDFLEPPRGPEELGRLGHYRVVKLLGAGGMGAVFKAVDEQLGRTVALKTLRPALAHDPLARKRFLREARSAAALHHDHVVTIFQVGEERGVPFLAMPLLHGVALDDWLKEPGRRPIAEVLRIGREVAEGLAAAHAQGLIHRDIKPANIWLEGSRKRVKILDFGLARAADGAEANLTHSGAIVGTPAFMAPEQAAGEALDHRCDLFSLGVVLYRMATGVMPWKGQGTLSVLRSMALDDPPSPIEVSPEVPPALSDLVTRLLSRDRDGRPASARAVADELAALEAAPPAEPPGPPPVKAAPEPELAPSPSGRRRLVGSLVAAAMVGGLLVAWQVVVKIRDKEGHETIIQAPPGSTVTVETAPTPASVPSVPAKAASTAVPAGGFDRLDPSRIPASERFPWQPEELVAVFGEHRMRHWGPVRCLALSADGRTVATGGAIDGTIRLWDVASSRLRDEVTVLEVWGSHLAAGGHIKALAFSPDGRTLAAGYGGGLHLWDVGPEGLKKRSILDPAVERVIALEFSPDGRTLAAHGHRSLRLWDMTGPISKPGATVEVGKDDADDQFLQATLGFAPDGKALAVVGHPDRRIRLFDVVGTADLKEQPALDVEETPLSLAFSPDGKTLVSVLAGFTLQVWDRDGAKTTPRARTPVLQAGSLPRSLGFASGGKLVVLGGGNEVEFWGVDGPQIEIKARIKASHYWDYSPFTNAIAAVTPDGRTMVTGGSDGTVRTWDLRDRMLPAERNPSDGEFFRPGMAFSPDGKSIATVSGGGDGRWITRIWECDGPEPHATTEFEGGPWVPPYSRSNVEFSRDGKLLAIPFLEGARLQRLPGGGTGDGLTLKVPFLRNLALSPDGTSLATVDHGNKVKLWRLNRTAPDVRADLASEMLGGLGGCLAFSPDGRSLLTGSPDPILLWDLAPDGPRERVRHKMLGQALFGGTFSPDGRTLILEVSGQSQAVMDPTRPEAAPVPLRPRNQKFDIQASASFAPDGRTFATGGDWLTLWDTASRSPLREWRLPGRVHQVAFAPDGRHLASTNANGTVYILRLAASGPARDAVLAGREEELPPRRDPARRAGSMLDLDPARIAPEQRSTGQPRELVAVLGDARARHRGPVTGVAISPDASTVVSGGDDGLIRFWDARSMRPRAEVACPGGVVSMAYHPGGKALICGLGGRVIRLDLGRDGIPEPTTLAETEGWARSVVYSPDGRLLAWQDDRSIRLWDVSGTRPRPLAAFEGVPSGQPGTSVAFSPDGKTLVACLGAEKLVRAWDLAASSPEEKFAIRAGDAPVGLAFAPDGRSLVISGAKVRSWDLTGPTPRMTAEVGTGEEGTLAFLPDGETFLKGPVTPGLFALRKGEVSFLAILHASHFYTGTGSLALSRDGRTMVTGGGDGTVRVWDFHPGRLPEDRWFGRTYYQPGLSFSPDGRMLAALGSRGLVEIWDVAGTAPSLRAGLGPFDIQDKYHPFAFSPSGKTFAVVDGRSLRLWDLSDAEPRSLPSASGSNGLFKPMFGPGGRVLAAFESPDSLRLWDLSGGPPRSRESFKQAGIPWTIAFSPAGTGLIVSNPEGLTFCRVEPDRLGPMIRPDLKSAVIGATAFAPDGKTLVSVREDSIVVFDMGEAGPVEKTRIRVEGLSVHNPAFSPDGKLLAAAGNKLIVFDYSTMKPVYEWTPAGAGLLLPRVAFAPDGRHLATTHADGTIAIIRLPADVVGRVGVSAR